MHHGAASLAPDEPPANNTRPTAGRRRKGSLRKTALLGPARAPPPSADPDPPPPHEDAAPALRRLSLVDEDSPPPPSQTQTSPTSQSYASTTTDDDDLSIMAPSPAALLGSAPTPSYFNSAASAPRRRPSHKPVPSPLSALPVLSPAPADPHSYSQTSRWGWVLLCTTWVVFTVGMGSCLGVWSWAWDVGQTPYAPPELEDDPTLPIVGYYPALIILTAVMAWVWVVVAWVGMKYFKHAKIQGDDD